MKTLKQIYTGIIVFVVLAVGAAHSQVPITGQAITPFGTPAANVPVRVCAITSTGIPCTPLITIYADYLLTVPISNPTFTDSHGNYSFFTPLGYSTVQVGVTPTTTYTYMQGGFVGSVSGQANGVIPLATAGGTIGAQSHLDDGKTTPGVITSSEPIQSTQIGGSRYATRYQTGGGNNGIANAAATNAFVIADPSYAFTENPTPTSFSVSAFHFGDLRQGVQTDFYHNPLFTNSIGFNFGAYPLNTGNGYPRGTYCLYDTPPATWSGSSITYGCSGLGMISNFPGWSVGNAGFAPSAANGWSTFVHNSIATWSRSRGITESLLAWQQKYAVGDNIPVYSYVNNFHGGTTAASDEGTKAYGGNVFEDTGTFTGTCLSGCTLNSTSITTGVSNGSQAAGQMLIDTTQSPTTGHITAIGAGLGGGTALTIDTSVPVSNAWGTLTAEVDTPVNTTAPYSTSESFTVTVISGTFDTTHLMCFGGAIGVSDYHDQTRPTSVSGGNITAPLRQAHGSGTYVFQGGMCGNGLEASGAYTFNGRKYLIDVVGSTGANTLQVVKFAYGSGGSSGLAAQITQNITISNALASSGTTVTVPVTGGTLGSPYQFQGSSFLIAGASDSALNALCTNAQWSTTTQFTCTIAGLIGTHTTTTPATATLNNNGFNMYPMAEVIDVQNNTLSPPQVDGTLALEPNVIQFATSDAVQQPHNVSQQNQGMTLNVAHYDPFALTSGITVTESGAGAQGGAANASSNAFMSLQNGNAESLYINGGGILTPINMFNFEGPYYIGMNFAEGPRNGQPIININTSTAQNTNPTYSFPIYLAFGNGGASGLTYTPFNNNLALTAGGAITYSGASHTFTGTVTETAALNSLSTGVTQTCATNNTALATTAYVNNCALLVGTLNAQIGTTAIGTLANFVANSATMQGTGWPGSSGSLTITGSQADPYGGTNAVQVVNSSGTPVWQNTGGTMSSGATYTACGWAKGAVGGESQKVYIGGGAFFTTLTYTSSWALYSFSEAPTTSLSNPLAFQPLSAQTVYLYGWNVVPSGTPCLSPGFPTGNTPQTTPVAAVATPLVSTASVQPTGSYVATGQTSATTAQTLFTTTSTSTYQINVSITCDTSVSTATVIGTLRWIDPSSTNQSVTMSTATCTTLGSSSIAQLTQTIRAKTGTVITIEAAIANSPNYDIAATALKLTSN